MALTIAAADTVEKIEALLPWNMQREQVKKADSLALTVDYYPDGGGS